MIINTKKMIDCFIFYNELDILIYRLNILNDVVDYFVIVESTHTFSGRKKKLFYNENKNLFERFKDKIIHIIINDFPYKYPNISYEKNEQWVNDKYQRDYISVGLEKLDLKNEDLIIVSDADEIPNPEKLYEIKNKNNIIDINLFEMDLYYYNLNTINVNKWCKNYIINFEKYTIFKNHNITCDDIRHRHYIFCNTELFPKNTMSIIKNGGWHLSYFGDSEFIKNKIINASHQEYNNEYFTDTKKIEDKMNNSNDLFDRGNFKRILLSENNNLPLEYEKYLNKYYKKDI